MATRRKTPLRLRVGDWVPKRNGKYYCSPACGGGHFCLHADFLLATRRANALVKLLGKTWKPRVWENLGWHYEVYLDTPALGGHGEGLIEVYPTHYAHEPVSYSVFIQADPQIVLHGSDLIATARLAIKKYELYAKQTARAARALTTLQLPLSIPVIK